jgi:hypothetical protein
MKDYLWVLKLPKLSLALNFVLLFISLVNIGLIAYVILLVREQIILLT